jgi:hypothetical protein
VTYAAAEPVLPTVTVLVVPASNAVVTSMLTSMICEFAGIVPIVTALVSVYAIVTVIADS